MDASRPAQIALALFLTGCVPRAWLIRKTDPLSPPERMVLAQTYEAQGLSQEAAAEYRNVVKRDRTHVPALLALGDIAYKEGRAGEARRYYWEALKYDPENARANNNLAMVYLDAGKVRRAERFARKAAERRDLFRPYALDTLAHAQWRQGRREEALASLAEAASLAPSGDPLFAENLRRSQEKLNSLASP